LNVTGDTDDRVVIWPLPSGSIPAPELASKEGWNGEEAQAGPDQHRIVQISHTPEARAGIGKRFVAEEV
jgi:hypothetical protein